MKIIKEKKEILKEIKTSNQFVSSDNDTEVVYFPFKFALAKHKQIENILKSKTEVFFSGAIHVIDGYADNIRLSSNGVYFSIDNTDYDMFTSDVYASIYFDEKKHIFYFTVLAKAFNATVTFNCFCPEADYQALIAE